MVGTDPGAVAEGRGAWWDSGRVESGETLLVLYAGRLLTLDLALYSSVMAWGETGVDGYTAASARFWTGLLDQSDWVGEWIARGYVPPTGSEPPRDTRYDNPLNALPSDQVRREFRIDKPVASATRPRSGSKGHISTARGLATRSSRPAGPTTTYACPTKSTTRPRHWPRG
ncbi:hypothetical protein GCM10011324_45640 [Allosediminivita pacifica]|nr:hypothetical protein GCM10011324_45640 [Allosediminivita pacifica]